MAAIDVHGTAANHNVEAWYEANKKQFVPPICNKLMFKDQLTIMFVGGPNTREDFHLEEGSEFFFQMKGNIELPTIQRGKRKLVHIREGEVFLLPSRIPHSPNRPENGSLGLVIERERVEGEMDAMRWYTDFNACDEVLWERYFPCRDLGKDLVPVVQAFKASPEAQTKKPSGSPGTVLAEEERPLKQDRETEVPDPFSLAGFVKEHRGDLMAGARLALFGDAHPCKEFRIAVAGGDSAQSTWKGDTWLYQVEGSAKITVGKDGDGDGGEDRNLVLEQGSCVVIRRGVPFSVSRSKVREMSLYC